jgi:sodium/hydrogen antiporter
MSFVVAFIVLAFVYGLVAGRLERTVLTGPMLFTGAGMIVVAVVPELRSKVADIGGLLRVAEVGLVLLLFTDASRANLAVLARTRSLPARLLSAGILLTIALGALAARLVFPQLSWWEAGILSAILAPTDAGLGQVIVNSPLVPLRIRQALNVEAGLNDGMSVPFLLFFIALAGTTANEGATLGRFVVEQLGYGVLVGGAIGLVGGWLLGRAHRRAWSAASLEPLSTVALPLLCLFASDAVGASMFIAAFVAGLTVQLGFEDAGAHSVAFTEEWGQVVNLFVFFVFGMLVTRSLGQLRAGFFVYALLSLTAARMIPVAVALLGTRLSAATVAFMGWFGPRGLASIVLGLVYLEQETHLPGEATIAGAVTVTVLLSIFAHGITAIPGAARYARAVTALPPGAPERSDDIPEGGR